MQTLPAQRVAPPAAAPTAPCAKAAARVALPEGALAAVIAAVQERGVRVVFEAAANSAHRYVGLFRGEDIVLSPAEDPFLLLFTVAHLFGHLCQMASGDADKRRVATYVTMGGTPTRGELQEIFDYEYEAACIGRALLETISPITPAIDAEYARFFFADSAYLRNFLLTGECGPEVFDRFLSAQHGEALIASDPRLLGDSLRDVAADIVVV